MLLTKAFTKFGKTLWVGNRKRNARKSKLKTYEAAEVLEDRMLLTTVFGDFNGDGEVDIATGNPLATVDGTDNNGKASAGTVSVSYGSSAIATQVWSQNSPGIEGGPEKEDLFGGALAVGDFNNDGYDDLAIGVPFEGIEGIIFDSPKAGAVNVIYGSEIGLDASEARKDQIWTQDSVEFISFGNIVGIKGSAERLDDFGETLEVADFDNDGYDDLAIGVPGESSSFVGVSYNHGHGGVNIIYGSDDGLTVVGNQYFDQDSGSIEGHAEGGDYFGTSLSHGDFNGDGYADLVVGVPDEGIGSEDGIFVGGNEKEYAGAVNVIYGSSSGLDDEDNQGWDKGLTEIPGFAASKDFFGAQTVSGDFNADGYDDLAISVPGFNSASGEVIVIYGSSDRLQATKANGAIVNTQVWGGKGNLSVEDVDGDGFVDLQIGNSRVRYGSETGLRRRIPSKVTLPPPDTLAPVGANPTVQFPNVPRFLSPAPQTDGNPTTISDTTPTLLWTRVIGANQYDLVIYDKAGGFAVVDETALKTTSFTTPQLTAGRVYQAFVRAENAAGVFTLYSAPLEFTPLGDTKFLVDQFRDENQIASLNLVAYDVIKGKEIANLKGDEVNETSLLELSKTVEGIDEFSVYSRPIFNSGTAGNWTKVENFGSTIQDDPADDIFVGVPSLPTLLGPVGDSVGVNPRITWTESANAITYEILIYNKDKGTEFLNKTGIEFESFRIQNAMDANTNYQVFVRSSNGLQKSAWSSPLEFRTGAAVADPMTPVFLLHKGTVFNPDIKLSSQPTIGWDSNTPGETYEVLLYNKVKGQLVEQAKGLTETQFTPSNKLDSSAEFQMFVRAVNANGQTSGYSSPLEFTIKAPSFSTVDLAFINPQVLFAT